MIESEVREIEKFYDQRSNFGLDIPPGWRRDTPSNNMILKLNNNGSTFEVGVGPAQSPQGAINAARNLLQQQGAQIQNQFATKMGGLSATRLDYSLPSRGIFGRLVICVTGRNQTFLVSAESANFNANPINSDVTSMFNSFIMNSR